MRNGSSQKLLHVKVSHVVEFLISTTSTLTGITYAYCDVSDYLHLFQCAFLVMFLGLVCERHFDLGQEQLVKWRTKLALN